MFFLQQADTAELAHDRRESIRRCRQIKQAIAPGVARGFQAFELLLQPVKGEGVARIGLDRGDAFEKAIRDLVFHGAGCELAQALH